MHFKVYTNLGTFTCENKLTLGRRKFIYQLWYPSIHYNEMNR